MKKLLFLTAVLLFAVSCQEEFLERPPLNTDNAESFWSTSREAEMAVTSIYNAIARPMGYNFGHLVFGDVAADDIDCYDSNWFVELDNYQAKATEIAINGQEGHTQGVWFVMYTAIFRANWVLNSIDKIEERDDIYYRSKNEARFLRALAYFTLVNIFGDVPLYTTAISTNEGFDIGRTPKEEVYDFIIDELHATAGVDKSGNDIANEGLPVKGVYELGRATKGAALGLLARAYLYNENYQMAELVAKKVIDMGTYELQEDFGANFDNLMTNGKESVFEMNFEPQGSPGTWAMNPGSWILSFTVNTNFDPNIGGGWAIIVPDENVPDLFEKDAEGKDLDQRREMTVYKAGDKYPYAPQGLQWYIPAPPTYCLLSKYSKRNHFDEPATQLLSKMADSDSNIPVIRYAEILLIYAEACFMNGKTAEAFRYLNMIRERAGLEPFTGSENFMQRLMHERRLEFLGEGHRFYDLRRWGKLEDVLGPEGYRPETNGLFPLPQHELDLNKNLLPQNAGY